MTNWRKWPWHEVLFKLKFFAILANFEMKSQMQKFADDWRTMVNLWFMILFIWIFMQLLRVSLSFSWRGKRSHFSLFLILPWCLTCMKRPFERVNWVAEGVKTFSFKCKENPATPFPQSQNLNTLPKCLNEIAKLSSCKYFYLYSTKIIIWNMGTRSGLNS